MEAKQYQTVSIWVPKSIKISKKIRHLTIITQLAEES